MSSFLWKGILERMWGKVTQWSNQRKAVSASKSVLPDKDKDEELRTIN